MAAAVGWGWKSPGGASEADGDGPSLYHRAAAPGDGAAGTCLPQSANGLRGCWRETSATGRFYPVHCLYFLLHSSLCCTPSLFKFCFYVYLVCSSSCFFPVISFILLLFNFFPDVCFYLAPVPIFEFFLVCWVLSQFFNFLYVSIYLVCCPDL